MTHTTNPSVPEQGILRRALATAWTFLQALESGGAGYTFGRIESLERTVGRLTAELRHSRDPGAVDTRGASPAIREH